MLKLIKKAQSVHHRKSAVEVGVGVGVRVSVVELLMNTVNEYCSNKPNFTTEQINQIFSNENIEKFRKFDAITNEEYKQESENNQILIIADIYDAINLLLKQLPLTPIPGQRVESSNKISEGLSGYINRKVKQHYTTDSTNILTILFGTQDKPKHKLRCFFQ